MKKVFILLLVLFIAADIMAQAPELIKYQAVARDNGGNVLSNQLVSFRISILQGGSTGTSVYSETHQLTTNDFGLANLNIGNGTIVSGAFSSIDWSSDIHFLQVELDETGGGTYQLMGTSQLLSVPYALHAKTAESTINGSHSISDTDGDTKIQVEKTPNDDLIRFDLGGTEQWKMNESRFEPQNSGGSVFIGEGAGANDDLSDNYNVAIGTGALFHNTSNSNLVAIGDSALFNNAIGGYTNTAVGSRALYANEDGGNNTAIGYQALTSNTSGLGNQAIGSFAMKSNTTGHMNTAIGHQTLFLNTTGGANVALGASALHYNTEGDQNTAVGYLALYKNETGIDNTAIGYQALKFNETGIGNVAVGKEALFANASGNHNCAFGKNALRANVEGTENVAIGYAALETNIGGYWNTAIGFDALNNNINGYENTAVGYYSLWFNTGSKNTAHGAASLYHNTTGHSNTAVGRYASFDNNTGYENTSVGYEALYNTTTAGRNVGVGYQAGYNNSTGFYNTAVGWGSGPATSDIKNSTAIGRGASTTEWNQVRIGNNIVESIGGYKNWTNISDKRFKKAIQNDIVGLDFILALEPVSYQLDMDKLEQSTGNNRNPSDSSHAETEEEREFNLQSKLKQGSIRQSGFLAQDVEQAALSVGYDFSGVDKPNNEDNLYGLRYAEFVVPLVKAVQEQQEIIEQLKNEIAQHAIEKNAQSNDYEKLLKRIEQLENNNNQAKI